jgi:hypothetical protein
MQRHSVRSPLNRVTHAAVHDITVLGAKAQAMAQGQILSCAREHRVLFQCEDILPLPLQRERTPEVRLAGAPVHKHSLGAALYRRTEGSDLIPLAAWHITLETARPWAKHALRRGVDPFQRAPAIHRKPIAEESIERNRVLSEDRDALRTHRPQPGSEVRQF